MKTNFSTEKLWHNLEAIDRVAPEAALWLTREGSLNQGQEPPALSLVSQAKLPPLQSLKPDDILLISGAGQLRETAELTALMPRGCQVFIWEPRAQHLLWGLGTHDLRHSLRREDLVIIPPHEHGIKNILLRYPQLTLMEHTTIRLYGLDDDPQVQQVMTKFRLLLAQAHSFRELALNWEHISSANIICNLPHLAFMGQGLNVIDELVHRPAFLVERGEKLADQLEIMSGHLRGAALFCSDEALPYVLNAGIIPTAAVITNPLPGALYGFAHPQLAQVPILAEEVAHAATLKHYPGPRWICLGPRVAVEGSLSYLSQYLTPQHHTLGRMVEAATLTGCTSLALIGADLSTPKNLHQPVELTRAAALHELEQVLRSTMCRVFSAFPGETALPGIVSRSLPCLLKQLQTGPGQPLPLKALIHESWLNANQMKGIAKGLNEAARDFARLWQRSAAPMADFPGLPPRSLNNWLQAADQLFSALADQAAAAPLTAATLAGCLIRSFRRRYQFNCRNSRRPLPEEAGSELFHCLADLEERSAELSEALRQTADDFNLLGQAIMHQDQTHLSAFAQACGHSASAVSLS